MKYFSPDKLALLMADELIRRGVAPESVRHVTASLIQTSLRGVDSHGINLFPHYCRAVTAGRVNGNPLLTMERTGTATALLEADHGFGHHAGALAMQEAIDLARGSGMGAVNVRNSTHFGAAAYFALMAPGQDCLGFAFTNADALVKAFNAREAFCGTNPICFTAPLYDEEPFCLDMATSLVSWNKIIVYRRENRELEAGWAFDGEGQPVTDPHITRSLNPAGEYKGFGLGMMVDILCSLLAGGLISKDIGAMYAPPLDDGKRCISHFFMALHISRFVDPKIFRGTLQNMVDRVRALAPQKPDSDVMIAGDPEKRKFAERSRSGIPVDEQKFEEFLELSLDFVGAAL